MTFYFCATAPPVGITPSSITGYLCFSVQSSHPGSRHLPLLAPSPPRHHHRHQDEWKPPNDRMGPCHHSDHRTSATQQQVGSIICGWLQKNYRWAEMLMLLISTIQETSKLRAGGHGFSNSNPAALNQSCASRPSHHGSRGKVEQKILSSPADHTRVPYSHQNHHYQYQRHTGHPRAPQHNPPFHPPEDSRSHHHKQSTVRNKPWNSMNTVFSYRSEWALFYIWINVFWVSNVLFRFKF